MATVVVLGASAKPERYAHQAQARLQEAGHRVLPVTPQASEILGTPCYADLSALAAAGIEVDCVTLYVGPVRLRPLLPELIALNPGCVIANPGTDDGEIIAELEAAGQRVVSACTLVLLGTGSFARVVSGG